MYVKTQLVLVLFLFIYSKVTTCFGPYSGPPSGRKMNSLRKLYSVIYKIMYVNQKFNEISSLKTKTRFR